MCACRCSQPTSGWAEEFDREHPVVTIGHHHYRRERYLKAFIAKEITQAKEEGRREGGKLKDEALFEAMEQAREATITLFEEWAKEYKNSLTMKWDTDKHQSWALDHLLSFAESLKKK